MPRLEVIAADHGYKVSFIERVETQHGWRVEIAPQRWTVKARKWPELRKKESLAGRKDSRLWLPAGTKPPPPTIPGC